jgi:intracellular sulfur oxidation DsrE/DsrF family protein
MEAGGVMNDRPTSRRSFFSRLTAAAAAFGAGAGTAAAQSAAGPFQPARHPEDDWFDGVAGRHRTYIDAISPAGAAEAIRAATNIFGANKSGYNLGDAEVAIVICLRHHATPFAFNDAIWSKYGTAMNGEIAFNDPKTGKAPIINVYQTTGYGDAMRNRNVTLDAIGKRGVHFAVCSLATRLHASLIARQTGAAVDGVFKELTSSILANGHMVPAGVVAANRAQERGYAFLYVG